MCITFGCCRGGHTFVCFTCRTSAKAQDPRRQVRRTLTNKTVHPRCPQCRQKMTDLGIRTGIPRKEQDRRWKILQARTLKSLMPKDSPVAAKGQ